MESKSQISDLTPETWTTFEAHPNPPVALVFSDDLCVGLGRLTVNRCKAALPFAGKYRLIDFALSNCVNSEMDTVGVITQYQPRSLHAHLAYGRPWGLDRLAGGLTILHPYQARTGMGWYAGTADAVYQNLEFVFHYRRDEVLVLPGSQVYSMDLSALTLQHREAKADLTIATVPLDGRDPSRHTTVTVDSEGWVRSLVLPGTDTPGPLAAMGVLMFSTDVLSWRLSEDAGQSSSTHDLVQNVLPRMLHSGDRVMAFQYTGYWNQLHTVQDYWQANMDLLSEHSDLNLQDAAWPIRTQIEARPPTRFSTGARVSHSLLSEGCLVDGTIEHSVLSPGVCVGPGAVVRNSVVMHDTVIEERAIVENAILDADVIVGPHARIGKVHRHAPTLGSATPEQLTVVEKGVRIPAGEVVHPEAPSDGWVLSAQRQGVSNAPVDAA